MQERRDLPSAAVGVLIPGVPDLATVAALAVLVGATVQSATGFGFALIAGPAFFAVLQPAEAVTSLLVLGVASNLLVLLGGGRGVAVRWPDARRVLAAALPGLVVGALLLGAVPKAALQVAVGAGVLVAVVVQVRRRPPPPNGPASLRATGRSALGIGLTVGVLTTTTGTNGPPLVLWLERRRVAPAEARRTIAAMFLVLNVLGAVALVGLGGGAGQIRPLLLGVLLAVAVGGHLAGAEVFRRLDPRRFRIAGLTLSAVAGCAGIASALTG